MLRTKRLPAAKGFFVGEIVLDNPAALNALTPKMARAALSVLQQWAADDSIAAVVLRGEGARAFCAGGDVRFARSCIVKNDFAAADAYFADEYFLDFSLHCFCKPIVCWGGGVLMGGGMGMFQGCDVRVVLPDTKAAMPENKIGFFADVGAAFFMMQWQNAPQLGYYLGLCGRIFDGAFAAAAGAADVLCAEESYDKILCALCAVHWNECANKADKVAAAKDAVRKLQIQIPARDDFQLYAAAEKCFLAAQKDGADAAVATLPNEDRNAVSPLSARVWTAHWLRASSQITDNKSLQIAANKNLQPAANKVGESFAAIRSHLREVFAMDYILARNFLRRGDFAEGVRALLIDKDRNPKWRAAADSAAVASMFQSPDPQTDKEFWRRLGEGD